MGRDLCKLTKVLMTSSSFDFMSLSNETAEKIADFRAFWLNISKTVQLIFTKLYVIFRQSYIEVFEIKRLKIDHSLLPW